MGLAYYVLQGKNKPDVLNCIDNKLLNGWDRGAGKIWCRMSDGNQSFPLEKAQWTKTTDSNLLVWKNTPEITPASLLKRPNPIGKPMKFGDGQEWFVPQIRVGFDGTMLPRQLTLSIDGQPHFEIKKEFVHLEKWGETALAWADGAKVETPEVIQCFADVLNVNYSITIWEVWAYGLICDETYLPICEYISDHATFAQMIKDFQSSKKEQPQSSGE